MVEVLCPVVVGRDAELGVLRRALVAAERGAGGLVTVVGEPGIGKSRLVREVVTAARGHDAVVLQGRAVATGGSSAYRPWTEVLLQAARRHPLRDDPELAPWLPALHPILPPSVTGAADAVTGESDAVRAEAVLRVLRRAAGGQALLVVLEDLHWADPDSLAVLEYAADHLAGEQVLAVATLRTEPRSPALELVQRLRGRPGIRTVPLDRLDAGEVAAMVRACVPGADRDTVARVARAADGVPLLVEEVLASPGLPVTLTDTVRARLEELAEDERGVVQAAAVLGRFFDWRLLEPITGRSAATVAAALERAVDLLLLTVASGDFRFRHILTREAVVDGLLPPRRSALAAAALTALESAHPGLPSPHREVAADLAEQAGDRGRAGVLLAAAGDEALERGALATAAANLSRAAAVIDDGDERTRVEMRLVEALALAGRADEATAVGDHLVGSLVEPEARADVLTRVAHADVAAARWAPAAGHLDAAEPFLRLADRRDLTARAGLLRAEIAIAADDVDSARHEAERVLAGRPPPAVRCHALELLGRADRILDLDAARTAFEAALATAQDAHLPLWQMRALHELGTIDMFDHAGTERLVEARRAAEALGALSTGAVIDVHLAAAFIFRFELEPAAERARAAVELSKRIGLDRLRALGLMFLAEIHALVRDGDEMERFIGLAVAVAPDDPDIEGSAWAGARAMARLVAGDTEGGTADLEHGITIMRRLQGSGPANYRGLWPLLLAASGDRRAAMIVEEERQAGMTVNRGNRGLLALAEAVLAGRRGDRDRADALTAGALADLVHYPVWTELALVHVAPAALGHGWGDPVAWLTSARGVFSARHFDELAARCTELLTAPAPPVFGLTTREAEVLAGVARGLSNKEIAAALRISPRTVEKHIEAILRKSGARSRTHLVALAAEATT